MAEENLSELLFKPKFSYPETSTVSNSSFEDLDNCYESELMGFSKYFYRPVTRFSWVLTGGNLLDIDEALANICTSKATRTRPKLFDFFIILRCQFSFSSALAGATSRAVGRTWA